VHPLISAISSARRLPDSEKEEMNNHGKLFGRRLNSGKLL